MKKKLLKGLLIVAIGYALLVAVHFIYLSLGGSPGSASFRLGQTYAESAIMRQEKSSYSKAAANYATLSFQSAQGQVAVEQKYEKIGSIDSVTEEFEEDEKRARDIIKQHGALIQGEAVTSTDHLRRLNLTIGVPPEGFDGIVAALKTLGKAGDFQVTKTDKTNDFLELKAKRTTLEKARDSLAGLKTQGGKIEELVELEQEILKLEDQIQGLGVQLGQFDKVNEFCTVRFSLTETRAESIRSPHLGYLIESIQWAASTYLIWLGIGCVGFIGVILLLIIIEKSKIFRSESDQR
jgi:hypothetical protein